MDPQLHPQQYTKLCDKSGSNIDRTNDEDQNTTGWVGTCSLTLFILSLKKI